MWSGSREFLRRESEGELIMLMLLAFRRSVFCCRTESLRCESPDGGRLGEMA